jgi:hypothetical protein
LSCIATTSLSDSTQRHALTSTFWIDEQLAPPTKLTIRECDCRVTATWHPRTMARWSIVLALASALASALAGCDARDDGPAPVCDPFDGGARPLELRTILGIGRDANGTIYLADQEQYEIDHVFVSVDGALVRRGIAYNNFGDDHDPTRTRYLFQIQSTPIETLEIEVPTAGPTRMGVVAGEVSEWFDIGEAGVELELLDADAVADMAVRNLTGPFELEYAAQTGDGRLIVITRPLEESDYADHRLFLGPPDSVDERIVHSFVRELDGGTTTVEFDLDGSTATAYFPSPYNDLPWTLTIAGETTELTERDAVPDDVTFHCLTE